MSLWYGRMEKHGARIVFGLLKLGNEKLVGTNDAAGKLIDVYYTPDMCPALPSEYLYRKNMA